MLLNNVTTTTDSAFRHTWHHGSVTIALVHQGAVTPLKEWKELRPAAARVADMLGMSPAATELTLTATELAALTDYDAVQLGLPQWLDAFVHLSAEGRVDSPNWKLTLTLEPLQYAHPWVVYRRDGAQLFVGERHLRLNPHQLKAFELYDQLLAAGSDIALRLKLYQQLLQTLGAPAYARLRSSGSIGHVTIQRIEEAKGKTLYTREDGKLVPLAAAKNPRWAMASRRHYYLKTA